MMQHKELSEGKWGGMAFVELMANIGSEVGRTVSWMKKGKEVPAGSSFERALELMDLTLKFGRIGMKNRFPMLKELCRLRDLFCESYIAGSMSSLEWLDRYFMQFSLAWQIQRHRENADK